MSMSKNLDNTFSNIIKDVDLSKDIMVLWGKTGFDLDTDSSKLVIQKRNSSVSYEHAVEITDKNMWKLKIDFKKHHLLNGTWDYYIKNQNKKFRVKVNNCMLLQDQSSLLYKIGNISKKLTCYVTKNSSFSMKIENPYIRLSNIEGKVDPDGCVNIKGILENNNYLSNDSNQGNVRLLVKERNQDKYLFEVPLSVTFNKNSHRLKLTFNYNTLLSNEYRLNRWDIFLSITINNVQHFFKIKVPENNLQHTTRYNFNEQEEIHQIYFYSTIYNNLSLASTSLSINRDLNVYTLNNGNLKLIGHTYFNNLNFNINNEIKRKIIIRQRSTNKKLCIPIENKETDILSDEHYDYSLAGFDVEIPLNDIYSISQETHSTFDIYIQLKYKNDVKERKLGCERYEFFVDKAYGIDTSKFGTRTIRSYLHLTPNGNLKLEMFAYSGRKISYITSKQHKIRVKNRKNDVWLIGERPDSAQDTGYHFFKYCRKNYPKRNIYYVINKDSPDLKNIKHLGNIIYFGSMKHFKMTAITTTFIGSHDLEYILPTKGVDWVSYQKGNRIFLQHGVLGRKDIHYYKQFYKYPFTKFIVSSQNEYELVTQNLGYKKNEVEITGLSRFDNLLLDRKETNTILIMPTWRDWISNEQTFLSSEYFSRYRNLLSNKKLENTLTLNNTKVIFYPHYRMQPFISHFKRLETDRIKVIEFGHYNVQDLLKKCKLLITDFSSVSFDFNYMNKPVIFYHFDYQNFFKSPPLRPPVETFLGDICKENNELINQIEYYLKNGFKEKDKYKAKHNLNFLHVDNKNCERIFKVVSEGA